MRTTKNGGGHLEAHVYGVGKLFQPQARLLIPIYQRPYVWSQDRQWEPLWKDIKRMAESVTAGTPPKAHFLGAVVIDAHPGPDDYGKVKRHLVVDGQQRLTTIQLLLEALADNYERVCDEGCAEARRFADLARLLTRNQFVADDDKDAEFKVWPMNLDQAAFRSVMDVGSPTHLAQVASADSEIKNSRIGGAYLYFYERIKEWLSAQPDLAAASKALYEVMDEYIRIVVIDLQGSVDPQLIFETLNARGTPLRPSDLIKNSLFHKVAAETGDGAEVYSKYWMPFEDENAYWSETIGKGAQRRGRLDTFMHQYLIMQKRDDVLVSNLYPEYGDFAEETDMSVVEQLTELNRYGQIYRSLDFLPKESRQATFIYRLRQMDITTIMPFVLRLMGDPGLSADDRIDDRIRIMEYLESYLVRRLVCHLTGKAYNRKFVDLLRVTDEKGITPDVVCDLLLGWDEDTTVWPDDDMFRTAWMSYGAYNWMAQARVRMILEALEPVIRSSKTEDVDFREALTIEHLMPQKWRANYPLPVDGSVDEFTRDNMLNTFGNLTLLNKKLNPAVSNGAWTRIITELVDGQDAQVDRGKRAEILRYAGLSISKMLIDYPVWDESAIRSRGERLFDAALETWPRPKSSKPTAFVMPSEPTDDLSDGENIAQDEELADFVVLENDSVALVPAQGEMGGMDKTDCEKVLLYCPAIASDTLLYYVRQGDSYSLRTYGGHLGTNSNGQHAEGAHNAADFERMYRPDRWREMSHMETAVTREDRWERVIAEQWTDYQSARLSS